MANTVTSAARNTCANRTTGNGVTGVCPKRISKAVRAAPLPIQTGDSELVSQGGRKPDLPNWESNAIDVWRLLHGAREDSAWLRRPLHWRSRRHAGSPARVRFHVTIRLPVITQDYKILLTPNGRKAATQDGAIYCIDIQYKVRTSRRRAGRKRYGTDRPDHPRTGTRCDHRSRPRST